MSNDNISQEAAFAIVLDDTNGAVKAQAIRLAALLKLPDLVKDGPKDVAELARITKTHQGSLYRLLYALASCGYFEEVEPGVFGQSSLSYVLRTDIPRSLNATALMRSEDWQFATLQHALQSIQTGKEVFSETFGKGFWTYLAEDNPEAGQRFAQAMSSVSAQGDQAVAASYDFSSAKTIVDLGGGHGGLLTTILKMYPDTRGILFDQETVIETARQSASTDGLKERLTLVGGNFFAELPSGGDVYLLKHILHDWEDRSCIQLLANCRQSMHAESRLLVIDEITTPGQKVSPSVALLDLFLLLLLPGRKRSETDYNALFTASGLQLLQVHLTASNYAILETARKEQP